MKFSRLLNHTFPSPNFHLSPIDKLKDLEQQHEHGNLTAR